jgi:hypothetical protein
VTVERDRERIKPLERENRELKRANDILKSQRLSSGRSSTASPGNRRVHYREPVTVWGRADLQVLAEHGCPIAPSTYYWINGSSPFGPTSWSDPPSI